MSAQNNNIMVQEVQWITRQSRLGNNASLANKYAQLLMGLELALFDVVSLYAAIFAAMQIRHQPGWRIGLVYNQIFIILALILVLIFWRSGLYPGQGINRPEELHRMVINISFSFLILIGITFVFQTTIIYSRLVLAFAWVLSVVFMPGARVLARKLFIRLGLWGEPVVVIGDQDKALSISDYFINKTHFGIRPISVLCEEHCASDDVIHYPLLTVNQIKDFAREHGLRTALLIINDLSTAETLISRYQFIFKRVILVKYQNGSYGLNKLKSLDFSEVLGLQVIQNLLSVQAQWVKRAIDLAVSICGLMVLAPFFALVAALVKLDSPGKVFYQQERLGRGGQIIKMHKFRTMRQDADVVLQEHLESDPEIKAEWDTYQKLQKDRRITRVGKILRRFSIDELPQLWNVLAGEMSLVGPRPMMINQAEMYGKYYQYYVQVTPGVTGLWQISGRNRTTFQRRAELDSEYIQTWSIWLDTYIMVRTVLVVLSRDGAG
jgi:Undecaprenyl-phosphate galactose phosphotransferase WbaP